MQIAEPTVDPSVDERPITTKYSANTSADQRFDQQRESRSTETKVRHINYLKKGKVYDPKEAIRN